MIYGNYFLKSKYDLTVDQISSLVESLKGINIDEEYISEAYNAYNHSSSVLLEASGVSESAINQAAKPAAEKIAKTIQKDGLNENSRRDIKKIYDDFLKTVEKIIDKCAVPKKIKEKIKEGEYDANKIKKAIILLIFTIAVSKVIAAVLSIIFKTAGVYIFTVIGGPIIEESAKAIAINGGYVTEFTICFNIFEFSEYVAMGVIANSITKAFMKALGAENAIPSTGIKTLVRTRLRVVAFHCTTTLIQFFTHNEELQKKIGMTSEEDKEKLTFLGRLIGILMHIAWNGLATFSPSVLLVGIE